jgi:hypothetical protein
MPVNGAPLFPDAPVNANTNGNTSANTSADSNAAAQPKSKIPPTPLGQ